MSDLRYEIISTAPTTYQDPTAGIVNGVLVRFRLTDYDEVHEVRVPKPDVKVTRDAIENVLAFRDQLAGVSTTGKK